jgi:hypothetical protein
MGEIVNLRRARKTRVRARATEEAAANRAKHGRSATDRAAAKAAFALEERRLDAHKRAEAHDNDADETQSTDRAE